MTGAALTFVSLHLIMMLMVPTAWARTPPPPSRARYPPIISSSSSSSSSALIPNHHHHPAFVRHCGSSSSSTSLRKSTTDTTNNEVINSILAEINALRTTVAISFPYLRIGPRVGSGSYGTVHQGYLIHSKDKDTDDFDAVVKPCIAKRAWTLAELELNIPSLILKLEQDAKQKRGDNDNTNLVMAQRTGLAFSASATSSSSLSSSSSSSLLSSSSSANSEKDISASDLKSRAARCEHYWEVERHCFQKMMMAMQVNPNNSITTTTTATGKAVPPLFWGVYRDDGKGGGTSVDNGVASIPGYGATSSPPRRKQSSNGNNFWFLDNNNSGGGTSDDGDSVGHEWMVFEFVGTATAGDDGLVDEPAQTLFDAMERDWNNQHRIGKDNHHPLFEVQKALNLPEMYTFGDTLDAIFMSILENLIVIHELNIAHRDLKPGNLLCDGTSQQLRLFDFGSAADLDLSPIPPESRTLFSGGTRRVGYDEGIAAISPAYCAPETFIELNANPLSFDIFSAGLIMSQLLFNLLDERTDAGFLQRLKDVNYDLDAWLESELGAKLRPSGLDGGLEYLSERRGLWSLLKQMFQPNPMMRVSSSKALDQLRMIIGVRKGDVEWSESDIAKVAREESYFETVIESLESCSFSIGIENMPRPLHFLATFKKGAPIGLMLAEASEVENDGSMSSNEWEQWKRATERALPGEVFVRGWDELSQAGQLGIFEVGDRLRGIGELPFVDGGFEQAITLINRQPKGGASLKLHFDRIPSPKASMTKSDQSQNGSRCIKVGGQGAWKSGGRRGAQEDTFVLHEIKNDQRGEDILLAGVFDGHAGTAASETVSGILPSLFTAELMASSETPVRIALENSWETTCNTYRSGCDENGECVAEYDPREGILFAETGSKDLVAGTTATIVAISMNPSGTDELTILNCGDSRTLVIGQPNSPTERGAASVVVFETRDHSPDDEIEIQRLEQGYAAGLDYSIPQCSPAGSYMVVGDYQYALCRSLEGTFTTSKGIVSDPDVFTLDLASSLADRRHCAVVLACDGLFEVMSNEEVGREVIRMRKEGYKAGDIAKNLCGQALKKGSYDNLSVVVVYLDHVL